MWIAFDGANNMSGHKTGVYARLKAEKCTKSEYVHCRSHLLQLACVYACEKIKPIKSLFSAINSLYRLFSLSPKRTHALIEIQEALQDPNLSLVRAGDTRWTSHYRAVKAVVKCLRSIIATLQHLHQDSGDLSSEAGGLLLMFQDKKSMILLFAVKDILEPICRLSAKLQNANATLHDFPDLLEAAQARLEEIKAKKEYLTTAAEFITDSGMAILESSQMSNDQIHSKLVIPYITQLSENMKSRFSGKVMNMCNTVSIFNPKNISDSENYSSQLTALASLHHSICLSDLKDEWKTFYNYLKMQSIKEECPSGNEILQKLAAKSGDLGEAFPQLALVSKVILVCPLGTASVERSFSTMARVCNRMRQRLLPDNLAHCMRVSLEGPAVLTDEQAIDIVKKWHAQHPHRRIRI